MSNSAARAEARSFVSQALENAADQSRFESRRNAFPLLTELGCLPSSLDEIVFDNGPSVFHSLAFRMATYNGESLFHRWEKILSQARECEGWESEYSNWSSMQDHWATKWSKFNQFLWMLQSYEYFSDTGGEVSFPYSNTIAKPDIHVRYGDGSNLYVECYYYTKWWGTEQLVEELLYALDPNLSIERMHNLRYDNNLFADTPDKAVVEALAELRKHLSPGKLADLKEQAHSETPVEVCKLGDFVVLLDGPGDYRPRHNAHGDPKYSWPVFRNEILRSKAESNGLSNHKPNLLLVNCLGIDYQFSLNETSEVSCLPPSLDEVWFCACGVDERIENSRRLMVHKPIC
ncbi:hypothetical protein [uncultured Mameliella sp.]|uniref:hypothetical protein n=1 Tax=uncultured Mameliella sp. TaxID=1447087 RepID=UPI002608FF70|nr:hypothetical protein [uncultured Mameliella sp.]